MWQPVQKLADIPIDSDLRLAVIENGVVHDLVFPCRRVGNHFVNVETKRTVDVYPTNWQQWET
jgi:hypothetical protein